MPTTPGHFVGAALADSLSGVLCDGNGVLGGSWPGVFRLYGIVGAVWFVLWMSFASSDPGRSIW